MRAIVRCALPLLLVAASCGSDDGGSTAESEAAIKTLFDRFSESAYKGDPQIDPTLYAGTPSEEDLENPIASPPDASKTVTLGDAANDGTKDMMVTVSTALVTDSGGTGTLTAKVVETATGFEFLKYVATVQKPKLSYRIPENGLVALNSDGTGQAFIAIAIESSGTVSRTYTNVNPANSHKLVDFGDNPVPSGTATGQGGGKLEVLVEVLLAREEGRLVGKLGPGDTALRAATSFRRDGGPATTAPAINVTKATLGGVALKAPDYLAGLGSDFPGGGAINGKVELAFAVTGTTEDQFVGISVIGPFDPPETELEGPSATFSGTLTGLDGANNRNVEISTLEINAFVVEATPELAVSISEDDLPQSLISCAYLSSFGFLTVGIPLMH